MNEQVRENEVHLQDLWTVAKRCWVLMLAVFVVAT